MKLEDKPKQNRDQDATLINIDALKKRVDKLEADAKETQELIAGLRKLLAAVK